MGRWRDPADSEPVAFVQEALPALWPFFRHQSADVQVEACTCALVLCRAAFGAHTAGDGDANAALARSVGSLLHIAYQTVLTCEHARVGHAAEQIVQCVLERSPAAVLGAALDAHLIQILAGLPCLSPSEPLDSGYLFHADVVGAEPPAKRTCGCGNPAPLLIGAGNAEAVEGLRVRCARLFAGCVATCAAQADDADCRMAATNAQNLMGTFLQQYSVAAQTFAAYVYFLWLLPMPSPSAAVPTDVHAQVRPPCRAGCHSVVKLPHTTP